MENMIRWRKEQQTDKRFRIWEGIGLLLILALGVEFYFFQYGILKSIRYLVLLPGLFVIAWIDQKSKRIPNKLLVALLILRSVILLLECVAYSNYWMTLLLTSLTGFLLGGGMFLVCYLIARGGIGAGDVKLFAVLGYYLGTGGVFGTAFFTVLFAAVYSVIRLIRRTADLKQEIPFAPFVLAGTIVAMGLGM